MSSINIILDTRNIFLFYLEYFLFCSLSSATGGAGDVTVTFSRDLARVDLGLSQSGEERVGEAWLSWEREEVRQL